MAPQLALVLPTITPWLPALHLYIFSVVSLIGSGLAIIVPDTVNTSLPDNFDEVIKLYIIFLEFLDLYIIVNVR